MKRNKLITAVILALSISSSHAYAGGIPVIDVANLANTAANLTEWSKQLVEMKNQLMQQKATFDSLNGLRSTGSLLNNELLIQYLPKDYQVAAQAILSGNGDFAGISGDLKNIIAANQKFTCKDMNTTAANIKACEDQWNKLALNKNVGDMGYKQAAKNIDNLQTFVNSINSSTDPKSIQDLQARISIEQVRMQNEQIKLETIKMMQEADAKLQAQKYSDAFSVGAAKGSEGGITEW